MERLNDEIRDREKVMRGVKKTDTPILTGYQLYHNYFRDHEGLNGKTPAEIAILLHYLAWVSFLDGQTSFIAQ